WEVFKARITHALNRCDVEGAARVWGQEAWPSLLGNFLTTATSANAAPAAAVANSPAAPLSRRQAASGTAVSAAEPYNLAFVRRYRSAFEDAFGGPGGDKLKQLAQRALQQHQQRPPGQGDDPRVAAGRAAVRAFLSAANAAGPGNARAGGHAQWEALQAAGTRSLSLLSPWFGRYEQAVADAGAVGGYGGYGAVQDCRTELLLPSMAFATANAPPPPLRSSRGRRPNGSRGGSTGGVARRGSAAAGGEEEAWLLPALGCEDLAPVTVVGFGRLVSVFGSKQRPKLLTMYCSDLSSRQWVVKGGEDVRLD
ncbi:hypothetical protein Agub_g6703, partial [Astrephomene gubernaculifera]